MALPTGGPSSIRGDACGRGVATTATDRAVIQIWASFVTGNSGTPHPSEHLPSARGVRGSTDLSGSRQFHHAKSAIEALDIEYWCPTDVEYERRL